MAKLVSNILMLFSTLVLFSCRHTCSFLPPTFLSKHSNLSDLQSLISFKSMISSDPSGSLASWNDSIHFCRWAGVTCGGRRHPQRVVSMGLSSLNLSGLISPAIANLTFLNKVDLSDNQFRGRIPQDIGRLYRLRHLNLSANSLEGEYGMANKVSTRGDVYSFGILLLEMFTAKRPTDDIFIGGLSLRKFVMMALPERIVDVVDTHLLSEEDGEASEDSGDMSGAAAKAMECIASMFRIGISCSSELPAERMEMGAVLRELQNVKDEFVENGSRAVARRSVPMSSKILSASIQ